MRDLEEEARLRRVHVEHLSEAEVLEGLRAFHEMFLSDPCSFPADHVVRQLWNRLDFVSTHELITIGHAIRRVSANAQASRWNSLKSELITATPPKFRGTIWEVLTAGMFNESAHRVTLLGKGAPGYDVLVENADGTRMEVSCKSLGVSDHARHFQSTSEEIWRMLYPMLNNSVRAQVLVQEPRGVARRERHIRKIANAIASVLNKYESLPSPIPLNERGADILLYPWHEVYGTPWRGAPSVRFLSAQLPSKNEQRRFQDKLTEAGKKFAKLPLPSSGTVRVVAIRVPMQVSTTDAKEAILDWLTLPEAGGVSAVLLYRPQLVTQTSEGTEPPTTFSHEIMVIDPNPALRFPLHLNFPVGDVTTGPTFPMLTFGGRVRPLSRGYFFMRADEVLACPPGQSSFKVEVRPDHRIRFVTDTGIMFEARHPPPTDLLIL